MVTVAVAAILLALAAPAMTNVLTQRAVVAQSSELVEAMHFARSEAMKRSAPVSLCKVASANATTCATAGGVTWQYWFVFAELAGGNPCQYDSGEPSLRKSQSSGRVQPPVSDPATLGCITFQSTGIALADSWSTATSGGAKALSITISPNMAGSAGSLARYVRKVCLNGQGRAEAVDGTTSCP
jgi:type IV fimbrial biogenesis protein FimT